jgi:hypothetical protein
MIYFENADFVHTSFTPAVPKRHNTDDAEKMWKCEIIVFYNNIHSNRLQSSTPPSLLSTKRREKMTTTYEKMLQKPIDAVNRIQKYTNQIRAWERDDVIVTLRQCVETTMARIKEGEELIKEQNATIKRQERDLRCIKRNVAGAERELKPESSKSNVIQKASSYHTAAPHTTEVLKEDPAFNDLMQCAWKAVAAIDKYTNQIRAFERDHVIRSVHLFVDAARTRDQELRNVIQRQAKNMALQLNELEQQKKEFARLTGEVEKIAEERRKSQAERRQSFVA